MGVLFFMVAAPVFLLLGVCWLINLIGGIEYSIFSWQAGRKAKKSNEIFQELIDQGWDAREATIEAHRRAFGK